MPCIFFHVLIVHSFHSNHHRKYDSESATVTCVINQPSQPTIAQLTWSMGSTSPGASSTGYFESSLRTSSSSTSRCSQNSRDRDAALIPPTPSPTAPAVTAPASSTPSFPLPPTKASVPMGTVSTASSSSGLCPRKGDLSPCL